MRSTLAAVGIGSALALGLAGCGGGGGDTVEPSAYASAICSGMTTYGEAISSAVADLQSAIGDGATPEDRQAALVAYVDAIDLATGDMVSASDSAGTPDADNGERLSEALTKAFNAMRQAASDARPRAAELEAADQAAFGTAAQELLQPIEDGFTSVEKEVEDVDSEELDAAFDTAPGCADISG